MVRGFGTQIKSTAVIYIFPNKSGYWSLGSQWCQYVFLLHFQINFMNLININLSEWHLGIP